MHLLYTPAARERPGKAPDSLSAGDIWGGKRAKAVKPDTFHPPGICPLFGGWRRQDRPFLPVCPKRGGFNQRKSYPARLRRIASVKTDVVCLPFNRPVPLSGPPRCGAAPPGFEGRCPAFSGRCPCPRHWTGSGPSTGRCCGGRPVRRNPPSAGD